MMTRQARVLLLLAAALFVAAVTQAQDEEPIFAALDGHYVRASEHRGKVVLLNFWATWCGPCRTEMPVIVKIAKEYGPRGVDVLGPSANPRDEAEVVRAYMKSMGMTHECWLWVSAKDMRYYGVGPGLPATVILDREGKVSARFQGTVTEAQLRAALEPLLGP